MSAYYPFLASQSEDGRMRLFNLDFTHFKWKEMDLGVLGPPEANVILLPIRQKYNNANLIIYRSTESRITTYIMNASLETNQGASWTKGGRLSLSVPIGSAIHGFTVGRSYTEDDINTYILYQDEIGELRVVWQDDDTGWKGPQTHNVLTNAEMGTYISCLTQPAWDGTGVNVTTDQYMNRCFFQEKDTRRLKEVWFDGSEWKDVGYEPTD